MNVLTELIEIDDSKTLKQSNRLVVARYRLTKYEQRLVMAICSQLDKNADNFSKVRLRVGDVADFCNFKGKDKYNQVHSTILKLMTRTLQIQKENGKWYVTHWLQSADYLDGGYIEYCIDEKLKPELLQLKAAYLSTQVAPLMEFKRDYSARLYFILKKMLKIKEFDYDLDFFRDRFQLDKGYKLFANIKNRIIDPAIIEINEKSDIKVKHEYIKIGRSYQKIHFIVTLKKAPSEEEVLEQSFGQQRLIEHTSDSVQEVADRLIKRGVSARMAKTYAKKYDTDRINRNLALAVKQKDTAKNLPGLIIEFIKNDTAGQAAIAKAEVKKREKEREADARQAKDFFSKSDDIKGDYAEPVTINRKTNTTYIPEI